MRQLKPYIPQESSLRRVYDKFHDELSEFFTNELPSLFDSPIFRFPTTSSYPKMNVKETDKELIIEAAVPGLRQDDVVVEYADNVLTISAKTQNQKETDTGTYLTRELHKSSFSRSMTLGEREYCVEKIDATLDNGVLRVIIGKRERERVEKKRIEVK